MEHSPYIVIKLAIANRLSVNLEKFNSDRLSILPEKIEETNSGWWVVDVFGDRINGRQIASATLGFIKIQ